MFGINNLGNDATLLVTLHHLRQRLPNAELLCICKALPEEAKTFGVTKLNLDPFTPRAARLFGNGMLRQTYLAVATLVTEPLRMRKVRRQLSEVDQLLIVGTGVLDDFGELPWGMPAKLLRWCLGAKKAGALVQYLAVGAGPIRNPFNRFVLKRAVGLSEKRSFRDAGSKQYLRTLGINTENDQVVPDLVFGLPFEWVPFNRPAASPPEVIGVGMMEYLGWSIDEQTGQAGKRAYQDYVAKMGRFVVWLLEQGYEVRLLVGEFPADERAVQDLLSQISASESGNRHPRLTWDRIESFVDLLREIARCDAIVASRFHNVICAMALGRSVISIGYAEKFDSLMREVELESYCQRIEDLDVEKLIGQFRDMTIQHHEILNRICKRSAMYRLQLDDLFNAVFGSETTADLRVPDGNSPLILGASDRRG